MDLEILIENVLNAATAGITIGCIYGLMCIGLGQEGTSRPRGDSWIGLS